MALAGLAPGAAGVRSRRPGEARHSRLRRVLDSLRTAAAGQQAA